MAVGSAHQGAHQSVEVRDGTAATVAAAPVVADIAIIGFGSRGLSVLERVVTLARDSPKSPAGKRGPVRVAVVDPAGTGCGVHAPDLPDYLLLNSPCAEVSMFPDEGTVPLGTVRRGPSLYEWVSEGVAGPQEDSLPRRRPVHPADYLPRNVLGEYLHWFKGQVLDSAGGHVEVTMLPTTAVDIRDEAAGQRSIVCADGSTVLARHVFLTTGYTAENAPPDEPGREQTIGSPYPLPGDTGAIAPGQSAAIAGFGLSAMDVIACLTVGRGGRFSGRGERMRYLPSGAEPVLLLYSRTGAPYRVRPRIGRDGPADPPVAFTTAAIDALRRSRGPRLDFRIDVLPLLLTEMHIAYRRAQARRARLGDVLLILDDLSRDPEPARLHRTLDALATRLGAFDAWAALDGTAGMARRDSAQYARWLVDAMRSDLREGARPLSESPLKAALEVMEDHRDVIRHAIDFDGITDRSRAYFTGPMTSLFNRAVVGPQWERQAELLAIMAAGVARAPFGPAPAVSWHARTGRWRIVSTGLGRPHSAAADWLIRARVPPPSVDSSASPLLAALRRAGRIRPLPPESGRPSGIDIDRDQHPRAVDGQPDTHMWVLGPLCEGATYYNNQVPSPAQFSRPVHDAHRCVTAALADLPV
ncbi:FAD/NAD(P)-binding protein [Actinomadura syzygii]|uniref:FAD/NAD(P)-binding protein n=1 Tax=Actinomadura syzygii TaxID=1427538 RepID=A0A5D0TWY1_9ACTN|nr:FAD/NAD(P)-binding protein [Actinomadura syzygii]TYC10337.1 FAD/NAD(P)-binding protein [Actinomadura syzygii]